MTDLQLAREKQADFDRWKRENNRQLPVELSVTVLTTGFWPTYKAGLALFVCQLSFCRLAPLHPEMWGRLHVRLSDPAFAAASNLQTSFSVIAHLQGRPLARICCLSTHAVHASQRSMHCSLHYGVPLLPGSVAALLTPQLADVGEWWCSPWTWRCHRRWSAVWRPSRCALHEPAAHVCS